MKRGFYKLFLAAGIMVYFTIACNNPGKEDRDGHKDLEGAADPANMGGKLGGSQSLLDRQKDSTNLFNLNRNKKNKEEEKK